MIISQVDLNAKFIEAIDCIERAWTLKHHEEYYRAYCVVHSATQILHRVASELHRLDILKGGES